MKAIRAELESNISAYTNKTRADVILEKKFEVLWDDAFVNILSDDQIEIHHDEGSAEEFVKANPADSVFYLRNPSSITKYFEKQAITRR